MRKKGEEKNKIRYISLQHSKYKTLDWWPKELIYNTTQKVRKKSSKE